MPSFLTSIEEEFNAILSKKIVSRKDILNLKTFIIECYENDNIIDLNEINNSMKLLDFDISSDSDN
jgi:hypothetical protein